MLPVILAWFHHAEPFRFRIPSFPGVDGGTIRQVRWGSGWFIVWKWEWRRDDGFVEVDVAPNRD